MSKVNSSAIARVLKLVEPTLRANSAAEFMAGVKAGYDGMFSHLIQEAGQPEAVAAVTAMSTGSSVTLRQRQAIELCSWPIFDKPGLPSVPGAAPEFLWLYCLPFVVQFAPECVNAPIQLAAKAFDSDALANAVYQSGGLNSKAVIATSPSLLTRSALQAHAPSSLAAVFVLAELGLGGLVLPPPIVSFVSDIECARVATFFAVGAARLPVGERALIAEGFDWPAATLERLVLAGLAEQGLAIEKVTSMPPCNMAQSVLRCSATGFLEFQAVLKLANEEHPLTGVSIEHSADGWAELHATVLGETEPLLIFPAFSFLEPKDALQDCVQRCCESLGIPFKGVFSAVLPTSSMLQ